VGVPFLQGLLSGRRNTVHKIIARILERYESGHLSRRDLIQALASLAATAPAASAAVSTFKGVGLNHLAVRVADIPRSRAFYQSLLGLPLMSESSSSCFLKLGNQFLTLFKNRDPGLDHYCMEIEPFKPDEVMDQLKKLRLQPRRPVGTDRVYFRDPDGLEVQLAAFGHQA
jgi:catechol 2,3-dioxygenase-like lactoylglutathione lyase family enzyme